MSNIMGISDFNFFNTEIKQDDKKFFVVCKTLSLIESDTSLELAFEKLQKKRQDIFHEMKSLGIDIFSEKDRSNRNMSSSRLQKYMQISVIFFCLSLPIGSVLGLIFAAKLSSYAMNSIKYKIYNSLNSVVSNPAQITNLLNTMTAKLDSVTPERKEELQRSIRKIVDFSKPYVNEVKRLSSDK